jgi:DNA repair exonuclease SbcCD ATPase subunit
MAKAEINKETTVIKFTEEEIGKVQSFKEQFSEVVARLGEVEIELTLINNQIEQIENYKTQLKNKYMELRDNEIKLAEELKEKYGEGEFDISTGIFTPKQ